MDRSRFPAILSSHLIKRTFDHLAYVSLVSVIGTRPSERTQELVIPGWPYQRRRDQSVAPEPCRACMLNHTP
jgi:hypothetical protein